VAGGNGLEEGRGTRGCVHTVLLEAGHEVGLEALVVQPPLVQLRLEVSNLQIRAGVSGIYAAHSEVPAKSWSRPCLHPIPMLSKMRRAKSAPPPPFHSPPCRILAGPTCAHVIRLRMQKTHLHLAPVLRHRSMVDRDRSAVNNLGGFKTAAEGDATRRSYIYFMKNRSAEIH
jgi:hypothetical protein